MSPVALHTHRFVPLYNQVILRRFTSTASHSSMSTSNGVLPIAKAPSTVSPLKASRLCDQSEVVSSFGLFPNSLRPRAMIPYKLQCTHRHTLSLQSFSSLRMKTALAVVQPSSSSSSATDQSLQQNNDDQIYPTCSVCVQRERLEMGGRLQNVVRRVTIAYRIVFREF